MQYVKFLSKKFISKIYRKVMDRYDSASYWTSHMVSHDDWINAEASMDHFHRRKARYRTVIGQTNPWKKSNNLGFLAYSKVPPCLQQK